MFSQCWISKTSKATFRLTLPLRALSASVSLPKSSGTGSWSVSDTGSMFCRFVFVVSPLHNTETLGGHAWDAKHLYHKFSVYMIVYTPDELLLGQVSGRWHEVHHAETSIGPPGTSFKKGTFRGSPLGSLGPPFCTDWIWFARSSFDRMLLTSLYGTLFSLGVGKGVNEVSEGAMAA